MHEQVFVNPKPPIILLFFGDELPVFSGDFKPKTWVRPNLDLRPPTGFSTVTITIQYRLPQKRENKKANLWVFPRHPKNGLASKAARFLIFGEQKKHPRPKDQLPDGWRAERFRIFDGGDGRIGVKGWNNQCLGDSEKGKKWKRKVGFSKKPWIFRVQLLFGLVWECFFDQGDKSLRSGNK